MFKVLNKFNLSPKMKNECDEASNFVDGAQKQSMLYLDLYKDFKAAQGTKVYPTNRYERPVPAFW